MSNKRKSSIRAVPVEFSHLPKDKHQLADQIAQQRTRLKQEFAFNSQQKTPSPGSNTSYPRSHTMQYLTKHSSALPVLTRACIACAVLIFLARRIGYKNLWQLGNTVLPVILALLAKSQAPDSDENTETENLQRQKDS